MRRLILAVVTVMVLTGCGSGGAGDLSGRTFVSTATGQSRQLVAGTTLRLVFAEDELRAEAGCNHLTGKVGTDGDRLVVSEVGSTLMACSPELMEQEEWFKAFLQARPTWQLDGGSLELSDGATRVLLTEA